MESRAGRGRVETAPEGLAVDGDELAEADVVKRCQPGQETALELFGVDASEQVVEQVVRGDAVGQIKELGEPVLVQGSPPPHGHEVIGPSDGAAQGDGDDVDEGVGDFLAAGVGQTGEVISDAGRARRLGRHGLSVSVRSDAPRFGSTAEKHGTPGRPSSQITHCGAIALEYRVGAGSLYDCFHNVNGENLFEAILKLCGVAREHGRPITFM